MTVPHKLHAAAQVARALNFLKSTRLVHADLACRNVLLFKLEEDPRELVAKITDFGLAIFLKEGVHEQYLRQPQATRWCSPETVAYGKLSHQSDIWSFGVTFWELFADGASPWARIEKRADVTAKLTSLAGECDNCDTAESLASILWDLSMDFPLTDGACPTAAYSTMLSCLTPNEDARPSAAQIEESLLNVFEEVAPPPSVHSVGSSAVTAAFDDFPGDADSISASTEASASDPRCVSKTLVRQLSSKLLDVEKEINNPKFEILNDFLQSQHAVEALGDTLVEKMLLEVREALLREAFLARLAEERKASLNRLTKDKLGESKSCHVDTSAHTATVQTHEAEVQTADAPIRELLLPRVPAEGRLRCWGTAPPLSIWTLWSLVENDALLRRDYASEATARAALEAEGLSETALVRQTVYSSS